MQRKIAQIIIQKNNNNKIAQITWPFMCIIVQWDELPLNKIRAYVMKVDEIHNKLFRSSTFLKNAVQMVGTNDPNPLEG